MGVSGVGGRPTPQSAARTAPLRRGAVPEGTASLRWGGFRRGQPPCVGGAVPERAAPCVGARLGAGSSQREKRFRAGFTTGARVCYLVGRKGGDARWDIVNFRPADRTEAQRGCAPPNANIRPADWAEVQRPRGAHPGVVPVSVDCAGDRRPGSPRVFDAGRPRSAAAPPPASARTGCRSAAHAGDWA